MAANKCEDCAHVRQAGGHTLSTAIIGGSKPGALTCHAHPPTVYPIYDSQGAIGGTVSVWPGVKRDEDCAEFKARINGGNHVA